MEKGVMIRLVSWNIGKRADPWHCLAKMAERGEADVALLQEAGSLPDGLVSRVCYEDGTFPDQSVFQRRTLVVQLSDRVDVEWFRQVPPRSLLDEREVGVSDIGTMAAAKVTPRDRSHEAFIAISMYARWMRAHPSVGKNPMIHADLSAHRILSDLSTFINYADPRRHRILAAGDLNLVYTASRRDQFFGRERTVWDRFEALGMEFLGPQAPNGRQPELPQPGTSADTRNVPTYYTARQKCAANAVRQLDYAFASRGFHERVKVRALNGVEEWGPSDHCRLLIEVAAPEPPAPRRKLTVEAIRRRAVDAGVVEQFDRFVAMVKRAGLAVQPQPLSVRIAPPANRTRFLMYARPDFDDDGGRLHIGVGPREFVEFFPDLDEREIVEALALSGSDWENAGGKELDATLDRIERFLMEKFPQRDTGGSWRPT